MIDSEKNNIIDSGIVVVLLTSSLYLFVYLFEFGYLQSFGIPPEFIKIDLLRIISILLLVSPKVVLIFVVWNLISTLIHIDDLRKPINYQIYVVFKIVALTSIFYLFFGIDFYLAIKGIVTMLFFLVFFSLFSH